MEAQNVELQGNGLPDQLREDEQHSIHRHHGDGDIDGRYDDQGDSAISDEHSLSAKRAKAENEVELHRVNEPRAIFIVVMGVSACGKSTVGAGLAHELGLPFVDADDLHPIANVEKMSRREPLTDDDRFPWLCKVRSVAKETCESQRKDIISQDQSQRYGIVVGCSALKQSYRDILRGHGHVPSYSCETTTDDSGHDANGKHDPHALELRTIFVHITGSKEALQERIRNRKGHFFKESMLDSQLEILEPPESTGEPDVVVVRLESSVHEQILGALQMLERLGIKTMQSRPTEADADDALQ